MALRCSLESSMPVEIRGLAPLLQVFDMPASIHFYRDVQGLRLIATSQPGEHFHWALLRWNGAELMLNTAYEDDERPPAPDPARVAAHGDTILFFGCEDLDGAFRHLRAPGFPVTQPVIRPYGMRQLSTTDPEGYQRCLQWPASQETSEQWRDWYGIETRTT
jgi:glyoxylase I family protein